MHRRQKVELLPLDIEMEKTLRNLKKVRVAEAITMAEQRQGNQNIPVVATTRPQQRQRTMEYLWRPVIREEYFIVRQPPIEVNNFELTPALITTV